MTKYQAQIDKAEAMIGAKGQPIVLRRKRPESTLSAFNHETFGTLSASGNTFTFTAGDLTTEVAVGDLIRFQEVSSFKNRGPFVATAVDATTISVSEDLETTTDLQWRMEVESSAYEDTTGFGVPLPPQSATQQAFSQDFRDGTLQISRAQDLILAAKGLEFNPSPGDMIQFGPATWLENGDVWLIHGIGALQPDNTPIIWQGIVTRG